MTRGFIRFPLRMLLVGVLILGGIQLGRMAVQLQTISLSSPHVVSHSASVPKMGDMELLWGNVNLASLTSGGTWTQMSPSDISGFGIDPKDLCPGDDDCTVEINYEKDVDGDPESARVRIRAFDSKGNPIFEVHYQRANIGEYTDVTPLQLAKMPNRKVWLSSVRVSRFYRHMGIGGTVWAFGDQVLRVFEESMYGTYAVHLFVDAAGWWESLSSRFPPDVYMFGLSPDVYYYFIPMTPALK